MELTLQTVSLHFSPFTKTTSPALISRDYNAFATTFYPPCRRKHAASRVVFKVSCSLEETTVSIAVAATVVGAAATLLVKRNTKANSETIEPKISCEECGGSGVCAECRGEGFVLKRLSDENAEKARLMAKNAATRYTAGLPKKWGYCVKCNAARSCSSCGGTGFLN